MRRRTIVLLLAIVALVSACDRLDDDFFSPVTTEPSTETSQATTSTQAGPTTTTIFVPSLSGAAAGWAVSLRAAGPFQIGMTVAEAEAAAGVSLIELEDSDPACSYYAFDEATGLADQIRFMVRAGMIARIDIDGPIIKTLSGAGVGSNADEVTGIYGERIVISPGHLETVNHDYLTYIPSDAADLDFRLRFETVDDVVTAYRIGRLPEVEWVGRCE